AEALAEQDELRPPLRREPRPMRAHGAEERGSRLGRQSGVQNGGEQARQVRVLHGNNGRVTAVQLLERPCSFPGPPAPSRRTLQPDRGGPHTASPPRPNPPARSSSRTASAARSVAESAEWTPT